MISTNIVCAMIAMFSISLSGIHADTGSIVSDGSPRLEPGILQVQQLLNQESMLRLTLDKQLQELRSVVYDLQTETAKKISNFELEFRFLVSNIAKVEQNVSDFIVKVSSLQKAVIRTEDDPVYFSAFLSSTRTTQAVNEIIRFDNLTTNEGGGYNPSTGKFICPRTGAYLLSYGFMSALAKGTEARLYINGLVAVKSYTAEDVQWNSAERSSVHHLRKGDEVYVTVKERGAQVYGARYTSFSAVYIH